MQSVTAENNSLKSYILENIILNKPIISTNVGGIPEIIDNEADGVLVNYNKNEIFDAILFFSPSGIESFLEKNNFTNEQIFCIGTTTASALPTDYKKVIIAETPTNEILINECINYLKNKYNDTK